MEAKELEKQMAGKGSAEAFPKAKNGKKLDAEADVKKKDAAVYKEIEKKSDQG